VKQKTSTSRKVYQESPLLPFSLIDETMFGPCNRYNAERGLAYEEQVKNWIALPERFFALISVKR
jgi:hypothetical protein